jgi:hypothetical protein
MSKKILIICGERGLLNGKGENLILIGAMGCHRLEILFHSHRRDPMDHSHGWGIYSSSEFTWPEGICYPPSPKSLPPGEALRGDKNLDIQID